MDLLYIGVNLTSEAGGKLPSIPNMVQSSPMGGPTSTLSLWF